MNVRESARFALRGVLANKLRSLLTMLGDPHRRRGRDHPGRGRAPARARRCRQSISALGSNTITVTSTSTGAGNRWPGRWSGRVGGGWRARWAPRRRRPGGPAGGRRPSQSADDRGQRDADPRARAHRGRRRGARWIPSSAPDVESRGAGRDRADRDRTYRGASHTVQSTTGTTPSYLVNQQRRQSPSGPGLHRLRLHRTAARGPRRRHRRHGRWSAATAPALVGADRPAQRHRRTRSVGLLADEGQHRPAGPGRPGDRAAHGRAGHADRLRRRSPASR